MTEPTIKMSKAALISLLQTRNEQLDAAEQTHKTLLVCAMGDQDKLAGARQTIKESIPYLHHHDNCQSYIERGGERDPCDCGLEAILNRSKS